MAYAFVQQKDAVSLSSTSTLAATFTGNPTAGNLIFVAILSATSVSSVTDTLSNTYHLCSDNYPVTLGGNVYNLYYAQNITGGGANTVTAHYSSASSSSALYVAEYSGFDTTSPFELSGETQSPAPGTGSNAITSTAMTPTVAPGGLLSLCVNAGGASAPNAGTGYNGRTKVFNFGGGASAVPEDLRFTSTASTTAKYTAVTGSDTYYVLAALFKEASGGTGAIAGTSALVLGQTGTLKGAGTLAGTSALVLGETGVLKGAGALGGSSALVLGQTGALAGSGALLGTSALTFNQTGALTGSGALSGASALTFAQTGVLTGAGALSGLTALTWAQTGSLAGAGALIGTSAWVLGASGTATQPGSSGTAALSLSASGTLVGAGALSGTASWTITASATADQPVNVVTQPGPLDGRIADTAYRRRKKRQREIEQPAAPVDPIRVGAVGAVPIEPVKTYDFRSLAELSGKSVDAFRAEIDQEIATLLAQDQERDDEEALTLILAALED